MKKTKLKKMNILIGIISLALTISLIVSIVHIFSWHKDNEAIEKDVKKIKNIVEVEEIENEGNVEIIEQPEEVEEFNPYWDYIDMKLINVNFEELKKENSDTVGWIQVNGTKINYPFVQTTDNKYYLTHSFYKKNNSAGWVFLDYRNNIKEINKNTLLYAHGRKNNTMFGSLNNILNSKWIKNTDNYVIKLSTESENTLWQVFSIYHIPTTSDYLQIEFSSNEEFLVFANKLKDRSMYDFNTNVSGEDKILTLSTCLNEQEKTVVHAKLIKREGR